MCSRSMVVSFPQSRWQMFPFNLREEQLEKVAAEVMHFHRGVNAIDMCWTGDTKYPVTQTSCEVCVRGGGFVLQTVKS